jgi:hypothetical protein
MPKFHSLDTIPAKVFFQILESKNYQLLKPKPSEKDLEAVFISIYDEFFLKSDNHEAKRYLEVTKEIAFINYKISSLKQSLHFYFYNQTTKEMRDDFTKALFDGYGIMIDTNLPFIDEVLRVLNIEIGILQNDLSFLESEFKLMISKSKNKNFDYYDNIGALSNILPNNSLLKEDMSLAVYITLEKQAKKIISKQEEKRKK